MHMTVLAPLDAQYTLYDVGDAMQIWRLFEHAPLVQGLLCQVAIKQCAQIIERSLDLSRGYLTIFSSVEQLQAYFPHGNLRPTAQIDVRQNAEPTHDDMYDMATERMRSVCDGQIDKGCVMVAAACFEPTLDQNGKMSGTMLILQMRASMEHFTGRYEQFFGESLNKEPDSCTHCCARGAKRLCLLCLRSNYCDARCQADGWLMHEPYCMPNVLPY